MHKTQPAYMRLPQTEEWSRTGPGSNSRPDKEAEEVEAHREPKWALLLGGERREEDIRWKDCIAADVREKQQDIGMEHNRNDWRQFIKYSDTI